MPEDVLERVPSRTEPEELHVEHVRDPSERVPVRRVELGERPAQAFERQAAQHPRILREVRRRVVGDERVPEHAPVDERDRRDETEAGEAEPGDPEPGDRKMRRRP